MDLLYIRIKQQFIKSKTLKMEYKNLKFVADKLLKTLDSCKKILEVDENSTFFFLKRKIGMKIANVFTTCN